jgi:hypothetical protein
MPPSRTPNETDPTPKSDVNIMNFVNTDMTFKVDGSLCNIANDAIQSFIWTYPTQPTTFSYILDASHVYDSSLNGLESDKNYNFIVFATKQRGLISRGNLENIPSFNDITNDDITNGDYLLYLAIFERYGADGIVYKKFLSSSQRQRNDGVSIDYVGIIVFTDHIVALLPLILKT